MSTLTVKEFYAALVELLDGVPSFKKISLFKQIQTSINSLYHEQKIVPVIILDEIHIPKAGDLVYILSISCLTATTFGSRCTAL